MPPGAVLTFPVVAADAAFLDFLAVGSDIIEEDALSFRFRFGTIRSMGKKIVHK